MKSILLITSLVLGSPAAIPAQSLHFEKDSLNQVFLKARQQNKPVLVILAPTTTAASLPVPRSGVPNKSGLSAPAIVAELNKDFLTKEITLGAAESADLSRTYLVARYPTYLYFNPDGSLLYRSTGNYTAEAHYTKDLQAFRQAQADPHNLSYYQAEYQKGNRSVDFLKAYLLKRRELSQRVEPALLDAYVKQLPVKAFGQGAEVKFVLENGPVVGSQAYQLTHSGNKTTDSLYKVLPQPQRVAINNLIIKNTLAQAIATKDRNLATRGANFARNSWTNNYQRGTRAYERNMLTFYQSTQDTTNYLRQAVSFYERYCLNVSADSAAKASAAARTFHQQQAAGHLATSTTRRPAEAQDKAKLLDPRVTYVVTTITTSSPPPSFITELNNAAWAIYQTGTHNREYLLRATLWSKRTVELDPASYHYDTLAHLLYRLQFYQEAEAQQQQAVAHARQEKASIQVYEQELAKMKKRQL
ncbi:MAG: hypothetical protein EOO62_03820 [Hymenobacter sp.]|nr:MAG: hypothetical protein EOO62_03820 [Hymenobacter sp.]